MLGKIKLALQLSGNILDSELNDLIQAAVIDLDIAGVNDISIETADALVQRTIISYVVYNFELLHGSETKAEKLKAVYDQNKAMLGMATGYTNFGV